VTDRDDAAFERGFAEAAASIPGVLAVALGGSRAQGTAVDTSDWDFSIYYRAALNTDDIRAMGWDGQVMEPGEWGGGIMNGGAFLTIEGRKVDLHYRDLDVIEHWLQEARAGRFVVERLPFYLAGIPSYSLLAELALNRVLVGELPMPEYPEPLRDHAARWWHDSAAMQLAYAETYAAREQPLECIATLARVLLEEAHCRLARAGTWVTNEKHLLEAAGLAHTNGLLADVTISPTKLARLVAEVRAEVER
jgi:predicted nucleotidyltransferase